MRPNAPLPEAPPFLTFFTPTFRRPTALSANLASVWGQTAVRDIEQIVLPDHLGLGIGNGLFGRLPWYAGAARGRYVHVLCDDDTLAGPTVVERVRRFAEQQGDPEVIMVRAIKGGLDLPVSPQEPPVAGEVDLSSYILRRDVWLAHVGDYGRRYEGDFDHICAMRAAGRAFAFLDLVFVDGDARNGRPEVDWA